MPIRAIDADGKVVEEGRATKIMAFRGLERVPVESAEAGEIVAIAGLTTATVANTIADPSVAAAIYAQPIDPPTLAMTFSVNDSPMAGREGSKVTSRMIRDRLAREAEGNVSFHITESADKDAFEVAGRGELQLGVLIETMRREGFELSISRPRVLPQRRGVRLQRPRGSVERCVDVDDATPPVCPRSVAQGRAVEQPRRSAQEPWCSRRRAGLIGYHGDNSCRTLAAPAS